MPVPLQLVKNLDDLAQFLGHPNYESMKGLIYPNPRYKAFALAKRSGGTRTIETPGQKLKAMQQRVSKDLTACFGSKNPVAHSFMPNRSVISNALPHVGRASVIRVDLKDFFHQINFGRVKGIFLGAPFCLPDDVSTVLAHLCCYKGRLPQGAPSSPPLTNYVCRSLDNELRKLAKRYKARYTRYADDLTFSFSAIPLDNIPAEMLIVNRDADNRPVVEVGPLLAKAIANQGFLVNHAKTRGTGSNKRQMVTGIIVNNGLRVPSKFSKQIRRALHIWEKFGLKDAAKRAVPVLMQKSYQSGESPSLPKLIRGKLAWLAAVNGRADHSYQTLAKSFNNLAIKEGLANLQVVIDPRVKSYAEAQSATWFVRSEKIVGDWDLIDGTAFKISGQEWVTCAHCIGNLSTKTVYSKIQLSSGDWEIEQLAVRVVRVDWHRDLAILRPCPLVPLPRHLAYFAIADYVPIQTALLGVIGFPSSNEQQPPIFLRTRVVRTRPISGVLRIEIDKPIQQGNSGGPVFDEKYRVVGVVVEGATVSMGMNSCVAATEISKV